MNLRVPGIFCFVLSLPVPAISTDKQLTRNRNGTKICGEQQLHASFRLSPAGNVAFLVLLTSLLDGHIPREHRYTFLHIVKMHLVKKVQRQSGSSKRKTEDMSHAWIWKAENHMLWIVKQGWDTHSKAAGSSASCHQHAQHLFSVFSPKQIKRLVRLLHRGKADDWANIRSPCNPCSSHQTTSKLCKYFNISRDFFFFCRRLLRFEFSKQK